MVVPAWVAKAWVAAGVASTAEVQLTPVAAVAKGDPVPLGKAAVHKVVVRKVAVRKVVARRLVGRAVMVLVPKFAAMPRAM